MTVLHSNFTSVVVKKTLGHAVRTNSPGINIQQFVLTRYHHISVSVILNGFIPDVNVNQIGFFDVYGNETTSSKYKTKIRIQYLKGDCN
jgi:hypothetical protein